MVDCCSDVAGLLSGFDTCRQIDKHAGTQVGRGLCGVSESDGICERVRYHPLFFSFASDQSSDENLSDDYDGGEVDERCQN
jgi:hypothetical protein